MTVNGVLACRYCRERFPDAEGVKSINRHVATGDCPEYAPGAGMGSYASLAARDTETDTETTDTAVDTADTLQAEADRSEHATVADGALACTHCGKRFPTATNLNAVTGHLGSGRCPEYTPTSRPRLWDATTTSSADTGPTTEAVEPDTLAMSTDADQTTENTNHSETATNTDTASSYTDRDQAFEETFEKASDRIDTQPTNSQSDEITLSDHTDDILLGFIILTGYGLTVYYNVAGIPHEMWDTVSVLGFASAIAYLFGKHGLRKGAELINNRSR